MFCIMYSVYKSALLNTLRLWKVLKKSKTIIIITTIIVIVNIFIIIMPQSSTQP